MAYSLNLKMDASHSSGTFIMYWSTLHCMPEDSTPQSHAQKHLDFRRHFETVIFVLYFYMFPFQTLIEANVGVKTTDGYLLRVFCIGFTNKDQMSQRKTCYAQHTQV
jgi:hypothetical protein